MTQSGNPTPQQPATPQPATPPSAPPPSGSGWTAAPPPAAVGPAGLVYGDVPNRAIAYIIDIIILFIINVIIIVILGAVGLNATSINTNAVGLNDLVSYNPVVGVIQALIFTAINGVYFIYLWRAQRGTIGQRILGLQVGNAADGVTITQEQGIKRWIALGAPFSIAQALNPLPGLGILIGLAAFVWFIALLYTTATSPTKQGIHDKYAGTIVAKAARTVA